MILASSILDFYKKLNPVFKMPKGIGIMHPFTEKDTWEVTGKFYRKYYEDENPRVFVFGINPGRFGGGVTGIPFTDPIRLQNVCGIENDFQKKAELSSEFIYRMIDAFGGPEKFYGKFFITALSPLGFVKDNKNLNYYDDKLLMKAAEPFMLQTIRDQVAFNPFTDYCFCLGEGENYKQFSRINDQHKFFKQIIPLPHPRWVMQYRRKRIDEFVGLYLKKFAESGEVI